MIRTLLALTLVALAVSTTPSPVERTHTAGPVYRAHVEAAPVCTFAAVGDSITALTEQGSEYPWQSWVHSANTPETQFVMGGWAQPGRTTDDMLAGTVPLDVDVLVIEGAVNDVNLHRDHAGILANLTAIVAASTVVRVVVAAIPPNDRNPADALTYNAELERYAAEQGWVFVDPWAAFRNADGTYVPGAAWDDLHPTEPTAIVAGLLIRTAIREAAR